MSKREQMGGFRAAGILCIGAVVAVTAFSRAAGPPNDYKCIPAPNRLECDSNQLFCWFQPGDGTASCTYCYFSVQPQKPAAANWCSPKSGATCTYLNKKTCGVEYHSGVCLQFGSIKKCVNITTATGSCFVHDCNPNAQ